MGSKPRKIYDPEIHPKLAKQFCILHKATDAQLAVYLKISTGTLYKWKRENPDFAKTIREGKTFTDDEVAVHGLLKRAMGYEYEEKEIKTVPRIVKTVDAKGKVTKTVEDHVVRKVIIKQVIPDVRAQEFWLRNRQSKKWRSRDSLEVTGPDGAPLQVSDSKVSIYLPDNERDPDLKKNEK